MKKYVDKDKLQEFAQKLTNKQKTIFATKSEVGSPLKASTVAEMTDQSKVYVYVGSESGYTSGNWYYYNGSAWTSGGVYNSTAFETDATLAVPGMAADAKAVGDAFDNFTIEVDDTLTQAGAAADAKKTGDAIGEVSGDVSNLKNAFNDLSDTVTNENFNWINDFGFTKSLFKNSNGNLVSDYWKSGYRVASDYRNPVYLLVGVRFDLPSDRRMFVEYSEDNSLGSWIELGWKTGSYTVVNNGYYAFIISSPADTIAVNDVNTFLKNVNVYNAGYGTSVVEKVYNIENAINPYNGNAVGMERGTMVVDKTNGWTKSSFKQNSRLRTKDPLTLKKGTKLIVPFGYNLWVSYVENNVYYQTNWLTADYICPLTTEYVLMFRTISESDFTQYTIDEIAKLIVIILPDNNSINNEIDYNSELLKSSSIPQHKINSIARIGYNISDPSTPPQNSIEGFKEAYKHGYRIMLCDVRWTEDNVPVALHDPSINSVARNSDGTEISETINLSDITLEEVDEYDFGIIKGEKYTGAKILRIEDFLEWCILNECKPFLEIKTDGKAATENMFNSLFSIIDKYNIGNFCMYCCETSQMSNAVHSKYPLATIATVFSDGTNIENHFAYAASLKDNNEVFVYVYAKEDFSYQITSEIISAAVSNGVDIGLSECQSEYNFISFLNNKNNLAVKWLAIRDMPFYEYMRKKRLSE